ncbi:MAG: hypothetical protein ACK4RV_13445 [Caulobacter sp.]
MRPIRNFALPASLALTALLLAAPQAAMSQSATATCSAVKGKNDVTGLTFAGQAVWKDGETFDFTRLTFNADCTVTYGYRGGEWNNGRWSQTAKGVTVDFNNGFATYTGKRKGKVLSGTMKNVRDESGTWKFTQKP